MYITYGSYKRATNQWALIFISLSAFGKRCEEASWQNSQAAPQKLAKLDLNGIIFKWMAIFSPLADRCCCGQQQQRSACSLHLQQSCKKLRRRSIEELYKYAVPWECVALERETMYLHLREFIDRLPTMGSATEWMQLVAVMVYPCAITTMLLIPRL